MLAQMVRAATLAIFELFLQLSNSVAQTHLLAPICHNTLNHFLFQEPVNLRLLPLFSIF